MCGDLTLSDAAKKVVIMGWVNRRRDLGQVARRVTYYSFAGVFFLATIQTLRVARSSAYDFALSPLAITSGNRMFDSSRFSGYPSGSRETGQRLGSH